MMATTADNLNVALRLAAQGFAVFPCHSGGEKAKQPMPFLKWRDASTPSEAVIRAWWKKWPDAAPALDLGKSGLLVIDADRHGEADGVEAFGDLMSKHGFNPDSAPLVATPNAGNHHFFRQPVGRQFGNGRGSLPYGIDVRGAGGYVVAPGTIMQDGRAYELWGDLAAAPEIPDWLSTMLEGRKGGALDKGNHPPSHGPQGSVADAVQNANRPVPDNEIVELLAHISADVGYHDWLAVLMAVHAETNGAGFNIADQWSASGSKYPGTVELGKKWKSFKASGVTGRTLAEIARQHGADLSAIAIKHRGGAQFGPIEAAAAARKLIEAHDGTLADAQTGEVVEVGIAAMDATLPYPPGLVGDIARWIVATARRPQPELAIGAALAIVGTAAGRQFAGPTMSGTHLYILGLAPTGKGKDHALQQIGRIMSAAGLTLHLGPSEFISMPAVVNFLCRKPLSLCAMDEFGGFMKRINSKRASGFESAISKVIRTLWSSSFAPYFTPEWAQKASETIFAPAMTLYGASTPEQFYSAMEGASLEDGTLNRFLLLTGRSKANEVDPQLDATKVPASIADRLKAIYRSSGDMATTYRNDPHTDPAAQEAVKVLKWSHDGSHDRYRAFSAEIEAVIDGSPDLAPFYARVPEMALRIATIVSVGRHEDEAVRSSDLEFGIAVSRLSAGLMAQGAADYMADNENQANAQKVMRIVKARGGRVRYRDLMRAIQNTIKARDLRDLLAAMCDSGEIERQAVKPPTGPETIWYQAT
jgi:hypothetical protein